MMTAPGSSCVPRSCSGGEQALAHHAARGGIDDDGVEDRRRRHHGPFLELGPEPPTRGEIEGGDA
jgi:hypothetical protein